MEARQLFYEGTKAYKTGEFAQAAAKFKEGLLTWKDNLKDFPVFRDDDMNKKDTGLVVKRYERVLQGAAVRGQGRHNSRPLRCDGDARRDPRHFREHAHHWCRSGRGRGSSTDARRPLNALNRVSTATLILSIGPGNSHECQGRSCFS